ncbi:zinc finger CCCH domain-containing protein 13-like [Pectinophora gossypiella]|uniref:zinc finger CCCH domain-containing protein 13-like n=1 Tax=Pectinophora gossypiella TaxID=13191 RepID=UPI00214E2B15|nr:zinc finger CCCH domain-containing protein 13-like [Pectinophora gossypiella]
MECQASDSKTILKVFDASKRKRDRKKKGHDDTNSVVTDDSNSGPRQQSLSVPGPRERYPSGSTLAAPPPPPTFQVSSYKSLLFSSRDGHSLALKAGHMMSTPRSNSPRVEDSFVENIPQDQGSFIYAVLEEAIKRDKKKHRHSRRYDELRRSRDRDRERDRDRDCDHESSTREHRHHRHRRRDDNIPSRDYDKPARDPPVAPAIDQALLFETFAKFCTKMTDNTTPVPHVNPSEVARSQSHKSLQCEVVTRQNLYDVEERPVRLRSREPSRDLVVASSRAKVRSREDIHDVKPRGYTPTRMTEDRRDKYGPPPGSKPPPKYASKLDVAGSRVRDVEEERYREYQPVCASASCTDHEYRREPDRREYREYEPRRDRDPMRERRSFDDDRRKFCEQKMSRSFDVQREGYPEDERFRRTARSESYRKRFEETRDVRDKRYDDREVRDRRYEDRRDKYYEERDKESRERKHVASRDRRSKRNLERFERTSTASREEDFRERDRYSERERDSGLSVADGETSTISGKSNYLRVVKQEIAEQRDAMDKMMKLWKELMRCFKGLSQNQGQDKAIHESAATVQESAAAQLRLWRECMRRYETVARDVGDTDARLMEEITKQRSEMAEMATMWQECLQRYRDMSNDFNNLKRQLTSESPQRAPPPPPMVCPEGEGSAPAPPYRVAPPYPTPPQMAMAGFPGSPLRTRASAPPAWWWCGEQQPPPPPRRRSSPESRASRSRDRRHRHKDRDESRYKEKAPSKPNAARSEHRHRKR